MLDKKENYILKLAKTPQELMSAQRLRYKVFVEEMGAPAGEADHNLRLEKDRFDPFFDHLILSDMTIEDPMEQVIGVYRLLQGDVARESCGFYSAGEYDLDILTRSNRKLVELGRSCIAREHRGGIAMHLLWGGLAQYVLERDIEILFGTASFHGVSLEPVQSALAYLYHNHLAPEDLRVRSHTENRAEMDLLPKDAIDRKAAVTAIPALIKGYMRLGGFVGDGAYIDHDFNTIDICLLLDIKRMNEKHRKHYVRGGS